jgi:ribonucleoside-diphosphate reductase alpha chain
MKRFISNIPSLGNDILEHGVRFSHHSSIAPTGTISLSLANNASNGIEPSFSHRYTRNIIKEGQKTKEANNVYSYEYLLYCHINRLDPDSDETPKGLPDYFATAEDISPEDHIAMQAAAQPWIDSAISKTVNVPTDISFTDFENLYMDAYHQGLKGCATFRFNPEAFSGVLVRDSDLKDTKYTFTLEGGEQITVSGDEQVEYDGATHRASNLFDALKEGYYGKL